MLQRHVRKISSHTSPLLLLSPGYAEMEAQFAWDDKTIRRTFIRKVYAILMVQLFVTVVLLYLFCLPIRSFSNKISSLLRTHPVLRQFPWNTILLVLFTLSMAFMMGFLSSFYNTKSVVLCLGITALVCLSVTIFSFQRSPVLFVHGHAPLCHHNLHRRPFWIREFTPLPLLVLAHEHTPTAF
uniref:Protein lifeguard 2 n=1 Tax=Amphilophus citrinellus TaxID=61819 RepID=A0A3Q0T213_AMPCI